MIAGAGIAGLTAAINLKRAGRAVRVLERHPASGAQRSPDWDAVENWTSPVDFPVYLRGIGIESDRFATRACSAFSVIDPAGRRFDVQTPRPFFYLVKRGLADGGLERGLRDQAAAMAIPIEFGRACSPDQADLWATGARGQPGYFVTVGFTFHTDHPNWVCGIVDRRIAPRAYAYLAIVDREATLAVVSTEPRRDRPKLLAAAVDLFRQHADFEIGDRQISGGSGANLAAAVRSTSGLIVGEAAGFQDFLWGFGIRHALGSGHLAAQSLLRGEEWGNLAEREIRPLVRASLVNRWLYERLPPRGEAALIAYFARHPNLSALVGRWYRPRRLNHLLWPLVAWHYGRQASYPFVG